MDQKPTMDHNPTELEQAPAAAEAGRSAGEQARLMRRRLLVAGAIGAPLVLTFRSTSAWAISAGCIVKTGTHPIPGSIVRVDENLQPIPKIGGPTGPEWYQQYELITVTQDPNGSAASRIADKTTDLDRLRALVFNQNIGITCLQSIQTSA